MTFLDVAKIALTVIGSIGGGGAIVFGWSGFLGKLWADRALERLKHEGDLALEKQRHDYAQLAKRAQERVETSLKCVQMELDTLGLVHSLRTKEEFSRLAELWKRIATLTHASNMLSDTPSSPPDTRGTALSEYISALSDALQFFFQVQVFIPEPIAMVTNETLIAGVKIMSLHRHETRSKISAELLIERIWKVKEEFFSGRNLLEQLIRKHIRGESIDKTERPE